AKENFITKDQLAEYQSLDINLSVAEVEDELIGNSYLRSADLRFLDEWSEESGYDIYEDGLQIYTSIDSKMQAYAEEVVAKQMRIHQNRFENVWGDDLPWRDSQGNVVEGFLENLASKTDYYEFLNEKYDGIHDSIQFYLTQKKEMKVFTWDGMETVNYSTLDSLAHYAKMINTGMMSMDP